MFALLIRRCLARRLYHLLGGNIHDSSRIQSFRSPSLRFVGDQESRGFAGDLEITAVVTQYLWSRSAPGGTGGVVPHEADTGYG